MAHDDHHISQFPELGRLDGDSLRALIRTLEDDEHRVSYHRRLLHGRIDILRAELVNRMRREHESA